jgi:hypothetical protein
MKKKLIKPVLKREERWKLGKLTCAELAELVVAALETDIKRNDPNEALRLRYAHARNLELLKLCGTLKASYHAAHCRTAVHFTKVPTLVLTATGGKPKASSMPPFTASLKKLAAQHGVVIHRFGKGAFILAKNPPKPKPVTTGLCDKSFSLVR